MTTSPDDTVCVDKSTTGERVAKKSRLRREISWTLPANVIYGLCLCLQLVLLTKIGSPLAVGRYGLALSITAPVFFLAQLRLSPLLATDMRSSVNLANYFLLRSWLVGAALLLIGIAINVAASSELTMVLVLVAMAKATEAVTDLCQGAQQRIQRIDRVAISLFANGVVMTTAFVFTYVWTESLEWAAASVLFGRLAVLCSYDLPMLRVASRHPVFAKSEATNPPINPPTNPPTRTSLLPDYNESMQVVRHALPLGITGLMLCLTSNIPRYLIASELSEYALGIFCVLAAAIQGGSLVFRAIEQPIAPRLAQLLAARNEQGFWSLTNKLIGMFTAAGAVVAVISLLGGPYLLGFVGAEYVPWSPLLAMLFVTSTGAQIAGLIESSLIAARITAVQLPMHVVTLSSCCFGCLLLIPKYGLYGAVLSLIICRIPYSLIGIWLLRRYFRTRADGTESVSGSPRGELSNSVLNVPVTKAA